MRTILIGDIHGCHRELAALLEQVAPDPACDRLILLGDLFDRGPDSWAVFQTVQELADAFGPRFGLLLGNHEDYLLSERLSLRDRLIWERVGRGATVASFRTAGARMEDAIPFLRAHCAMLLRGEGFQCVHAGLSAEPPETNDRYTLIHDHDIVPRNRYAGPLTIVGHIALPKPTWFAGDGCTIRILPCRETQPLPEHGVICIDTGCGKGGRLTAMVVEGGQFTLRDVPPVSL